jgi:hypothetical protein
MLPNPNPTFIMLLVGTVSFILIMFLPALFELKKPKDAGPRMISDYSFSANLPIACLEEKEGLDQALVTKIIDVISVLPNLEL